MGKELVLNLQNLVSHFYKHLRNERNVFFKTYKITPTQYDVMACLRNNSMNLSILAETLSLDSSTLVGIVDRLKKKGWVVKKVNPKDRRKNILTLSEEGREVFDSIPSFVSPVLSSILEDLEIREQKSFIKLLQKIVVNMDLADYINIKFENREKIKPISVL